MGELFGSIYCWLEDFFGIELANYLWGESSPEQMSNMYIGVGLSMLSISLLVCVCYYYVLNHPRLNTWWGWAIFLVINLVVNLIVGWQWVLKDYYAGFMVKKDVVTGKLVDLPIDTDDIFAFGVTNMIDALIAFVIFSCLIKWWSTNCSNTPF
ncbi:MAG: hypothetical protein IKQ72_01045 [Bacteroidaceae bacterium]|nr:hypothetical protein [Bacteroidaceae bacterium]